MHDRTFVSADDLLLDSFRLAIKVCEDGFKPDFLVGLWRGGSAVGIAVQEGMDYLGTPCDHIAVRTSYKGRSAYSQRLAGKRQIRVHGLDYLLDRVASTHSMLIVDDVYSTGASVKAVVDKLSTRARRNLPSDIRTASVWFRPTDTTICPPDYFVHQTDNWLVLPYEMTDLSGDEIRQAKPTLAPVLDELATRLQK